MTAPDFPPEVIEKAAQAWLDYVPADGEDDPLGNCMRAVLTAVADWMNNCDAEALRRNAMHDRLVQEARVEGARQVLAALEDTWWPVGLHYVDAVREAVDRIEKGTAK